MDISALVAPDLKAGASLTAILPGLGMPVTMAAWLYESEAQRWQFVIASPVVDHEGRLAAYKLVQRALEKEPSDLKLRQVVVIESRTPGVEHLLAAVARADERPHAVEVIPAAVDGLPHDRGYVYTADALLYEREVFLALQRAQPDDAVLRRETHDGFDFVLDDGRRRVVVEAKVGSVPVKPQQIDRLVERLEELDRSALLVVARAGFADPSTLPKGAAGRVLLVPWDPDKHQDGRIEEAVRSLLANVPAADG